jgi:hypothetical protein
VHDGSHVRLRAVTARILLANRSASRNAACNRARKTQEHTMSGYKLRVGALALAGISACSTPEDDQLGSVAGELGQTYHVGPGQPYATLQALLAAQTLGPDDLVLVDYRSTPYPAGVTFRTPGSAGHPITIRGVPDAQGRRPILKSGIHQPNEQNIIHFKSVDPSPHADYYVLENFEIDGSSDEGNDWDPGPTSSPTDDRGTFRCIFHQGGWITIRNTYVHDCPAHGIASADELSGSLTLEYCEVSYGGGGDRHHPLYIESDQAGYPNSVFRMQYCYIHHANGGNLVKSRAERNEIYYNWLEQSPYRELELIGADSSSAPLFRMDSDVVGNVIFKTNKGFDSGTIRLGHDWVETSGAPGTHGRYRFVGNTIVLPADLTGAVFRLMGAIESVEMHDNVFYAPGNPLTLIRTSTSGGGDPAQWTTGSRQIYGLNNWVVTGSAIPPANEWSGTITGTDPGFVGASDVHLQPTSSLINAGTASAPTYAAFPFPNPLYPPAFVPPHRVATTSATARPVSGTIDIGAYEHGSGGGGCTYGIAPTSASSPAAGGGGTVGVTAGTGCAWTATSNAAWLTITAGASGAGNGTVGYSVAANTGAARNGSLTVAGQTFTVNQAAAGSPGLPSIYTDETNVTFTGGSTGVQAAVVAGAGVGGSNGIVHSNLQIWDGTKRLHLPTAVDITAVQSTDKLRISLDVSPGRLSRIYIYFNDNWETVLITPILDQTSGYETFDIPIGAMRAQMGNTVNDLYFKAGDGYPDNGTLWVDEIKFVP